MDKLNVFMMINQFVQNCRNSLDSSRFQSLQSSAGALKMQEGMR